MPANRFLPKKAAAELLRMLETSPVSTTYDAARHRLALLNDAGEEAVLFRLPLVLPYPGIAPEKSANYVILLIQSGQCAVGYFENGRCLDHKVFRSYMVRKKQGTSQIKYLKTKGKSRAGSRVRLGETEEFFANINTRLRLYFQGHRIDRLAISCSKTLLPYLYASSVPTPFDKRDPRLFKIPRHIHAPTFEVLLEANRFLQRGELISNTENGPGEIPVLADFLQNDLYPLAPEKESIVAQEEDEVYLLDDWEDEDIGIIPADDDAEDGMVEWD